MVKYANGFLKDHLNISPGSLQKSNGTYTCSPGETLDELANVHFPSNTPIPTHKYSREQHSRLDIENKFNTWININTVEEAFKKFQNKKSAGPDKLKPIVMKNLDNNMLNLLTFIFKCSIHLGYTPLTWKQAKVIFIPKPGKDHYKIGKNFRPISLLNIFLKAMETLVIRRVDITLGDFPIHNNQHGFRRNRSTETAISNTINYIEQTFEEKEKCLAVFLDIQAAFDTIDPKHIKQQLLEHGTDPEIAIWYYNFITNRHLQLNLKGESRHIKVNVGFPQGGVCSAKFWIIAFNPAIEIINKNRILGQGFADDCAALIKGNDLHDMAKHMGRMLNKLVEWGKTCGLTFNPSKTVAMVFSEKKHRIQIQPSLKMEGKEINYHNHTRYLGVELDKHLKWNQHIENKLCIGKPLMIKLAANVKHNYGPKPIYVKYIVNGVIRPKITYACMTWGNKLTPAQTKKLQKIDRLAALAMGGIRRTTPQATLDIIFDMIPLDLKIQQLGLAAFIRQENILDHPSDYQKSHQRHWANLRNKITLEGPYDTMEPNFIWERPFNINLKSLKSNSKKYLHHSEYTIYTDGSKINGHVGAGFVAYHKNNIIHTESFTLEDRATVFQAEVEAIKQAAAFMTRNKSKYPAKYIKILVDSQAALLTLHKKGTTSTHVLSTLATLAELGYASKNLTLAWIKAHVGYEGNELADDAAKQGALDPIITDQIKLPTTKTEIKNAIKTFTYQTWKRRWEADPAYKHSKHFISGPNSNFAKKVLKHPRSSLKQIVEIITGHNNLSYFQNKLDDNVNPSCRLCGDENETIVHWLTTCPRLPTWRNETLEKQKVGGEWHLRSLLNFVDKGILSSYMKYTDELIMDNITVITHNFSFDSDDSYS